MKKNLRPITRFLETFGKPTEEETITKLPKAVASGKDNLLDPATGEFFGCQTPFSRFYDNVRKMPDEAFDSSKRMDMDIYMNRNMLHILWENRVRFLFDNLSNSSECNCGYSIDLTYIITRDHSYLFDITAFPQFVFPITAVSIASAIATAAFTEMCSYVSDNDNYQAIMANMETASRSIAYESISILMSLIDEYRFYHRAAMITDDNSDICMGGIKSIDITKNWKSQANR